MSLDFPDYVLLQDLPLEALERVLKRLALLEPYLSQIAPPTLTRIPIRVRAGTFSINCCFVILSKSTCFGIPKPGSRGLFFRIEVHYVRAALARRRTQQRRLCWERRYYSLSLATAGLYFWLAEVDASHMTVSVGSFELSTSVEWRNSRAGGLLPEHRQYGRSDKQHSDVS